MFFASFTFALLQNIDNDGKNHRWKFWLIIVDDDNDNNDEDEYYDYNNNNNIWIIHLEQSLVY